MKPIRRSPGPHYQATIQLLRTSDVLWNSSRVLFNRWDLSVSQFNILNLLSAPSPGMSQTELGRALIMNRSNVTGLVDRLEKRGLVQRHAVPDDRRAYRVELTAAGQALIEQILPHYYQGVEEVWGTISVKETQHVASLLDQISNQTLKIAEEINHENDPE
jgi:DNA-binding MarR family transcriptional regulator